MVNKEKWGVIYIACDDFLTTVALLLQVAGGRDTSDPGSEGVDILVGLLP